MCKSSGCNVKWGQYNLKFSHIIKGLLKSVMSGLQLVILQHVQWGKGAKAFSLIYLLLGMYSGVSILDFV